MISFTDLHLVIKAQTMTMSKLKRNIDLRVRNGLKRLRETSGMMESRYSLTEGLSSLQANYPLVSLDQPGSKECLRSFYQSKAAICVSCKHQ